MHARYSVSLGLLLLACQFFIKLQRQLYPLPQVLSPLAVEVDLTFDRTILHDCRARALSFQCVLVCVRADTHHDVACFATTNANAHFVVDHKGNTAIHLDFVRVGQMWEF